jgi:hypothetical protein
MPNRRGSERFAETRHPPLPPFFADNRQPFNVSEVFPFPFHLHPQRTEIPALEVVHRNQNTKFTPISNQPLYSWNQILVVPARELS